MEGESSAVDGGAGKKSGQQMTKGKDKVGRDEKSESGQQIVTKEGDEDKSCGVVAWCRSIVGMGLFITVIKNIISGVTDVMVKTTFSGFNPITLVFLRYIHSRSFYHLYYHSALS